MKHVRWFAVALVAALVFGACASSEDDSAETSAPSTTQAAEQAAPERVTIRLAASTQGGGFPTPYAGIRGPGRLKATFFFDTLTFPDTTGQPKPWLAESWGVADDGVTWTFNLRDDVLFHDGEMLTAEDVVFTFEYNMTGPGSSTGAAVTGIASVTAVDDYTVEIVTEGPDATFIDNIGGPFGVQIMPQHIWEGVEDPVQFRGDEATIGSGPYTIRSFDEATNSFDLEAFEDFFLGPPVVERLQLLPVNDELLALQRGEVDAASGLQANIPDAQLNALSEKYELLTARGEYNVQLFFNQDQGFPYSEKAFRQGVVYALDRTNLIDVMVGGAGLPGSAGHLGPANAHLNEDLPPYDFDPDRAAELFDEIGLVDSDGDGDRDLPDGSEFVIPFVTSERDIEEARLVEGYLGEVGVRTKIESVDQSTMDARAAANNYSMAIVHFGGLSGDPSRLADRFATTSKGGSFTRIPSMSNEEFDMLAAEQATILDMDERGEVLDRMQEILAEEMPAIGLYVPDQRTFVNAEKYQGWGYTPGCPPCGASMNKRSLVTGSAEPVS